MSFRFELDLPPTSNHRLAPVMTRGGPCMVKTPAYRAWMNRAVSTLTAGRPEEWEPLAEPVGIYAEICFPDRRRRDLDNVLKPLNDVITRAGIWEDDSLIHLQITVRGKPCSPGLIRAIIFPLKHLQNRLTQRTLFEELVTDEKH